MSEEKKKATRKTKGRQAKPAVATEPREHVLSGDLSLRSAPEVKAQIVAALDRSDRIRIRFEEVDGVDLSFIQILCAAQRTAHEASKEITFAGDWPETLVNIIGEAGLSEYAGCSADGVIPCTRTNTKDPHTDELKGGGK